MQRERQTQKMEYLPWRFCKVVMKRHAQDPSSKGPCISLTIDQTNMPSQDKKVDLNRRSYFNYNIIKFSE